MDGRNVLILYVEELDMLANRLQDILESSSNTELNIQKKSLDLCDFGSIKSDPPIFVSSLNHDLIFIVLHPRLTQQASLLIQHIYRKKPELPVLIVIDKGDKDCISHLVKSGARDIITTPLKEIDVLSRLSLLVQRAPQKEYITQTLKEKLGLRNIIGESPEFLSEMRKVSIVAKYDVRVTISGETGTGKEVVARAIHYLSHRSSMPFITFDCAAAPAELFENELFGHKRGAFTSASSSEEGLVHAAQGGTLFLDEIDSLSHFSQVKLLRLLQEKEYRPLGSNEMRKADVRIIAASNNDLEKAVTEGKFRPELYYRLNIIPIKLPPLRERQGDIVLLSRYFLSKYSKHFKKEVADLSPEAMHKLMLHGWPGNVRELENVIERAVLLSEDGVIRPEHITISDAEGLEVEKSFRELKRQVIERFEISYMKSLLTLHQGNITKAARAAKKSRRAFWQLMRKHRINASNSA